MPAGEKLIKARSTLDKTIKVSIMAAGSTLVWWLAGPYASELVRHVVDLGYRLVYGTPGWLDWLIAWVPTVNHSQNFAYAFGDKLGAALSAPFLYRGTDWVLNALGLREHPRDDLDDDEEDPQAIQEAVDDAQDRQIQALSREMRNLQRSVSTVHPAVGIASSSATVEPANHSTRWEVLQFWKTKRAEKQPQPPAAPLTPGVYKIIDGQVVRVKF